MFSIKKLPFLYFFTAKENAHENWMRVSNYYSGKKVGNTQTISEFKHAIFFTSSLKTMYGALCKQL